MFVKILEKIESVYVKINHFFAEEGKILMFHHVSDEFVDTIECCKCKVDRFKTIIKEIQLNYKIISIDDILTYRGPQKIAVITFDDGCMDAYKNAFPFLIKNRIPFTVYVTNDFIGKDGYIGKNEIKSLASNSFVTIGYHTKSHPMLIDVKCLSKEMVEYKNEIEQIIGRKIEHFAFPYGKLYSIGVRSVLLGRRLGYKTIVSTFDTYLSSFSLKFKFFLPRTIIQ